jgi:hypothetical protein
MVTVKEFEAISHKRYKTIDQKKSREQSMWIFCSIFYAWQINIGIVLISEFRTDFLKFKILKYYLLLFNVAYKYDKIKGKLFKIL